MINHEKEKMLEIIYDYRNDEKYREYVNSKNLSELSEMEQIALKGMLVTNSGVEVINSDLSNHYHDYNLVDISTPEALRITCMNMAIAEFLHAAFNDHNIKKYTDFNLEEIKSRMKGDLFSTYDKPMIIKFIRFYSKKFPDYLPKKAKKFLDIYQGHIKNEIGTEEFIGLAHTFNTNIYLSDLSEYSDRKVFFRRK